MLSGSLSSERIRSISSAELIGSPPIPVRFRGRSRRNRTQVTGRKEREREEVGVGPRCSSRIVNRAGTEGYIVSRLAGKTVLLVVGQSEGEGSTSSISDKSHGGPFVPTVPGLEPRVFHQVFPAINVRPPSDRSFSTAADSSRRRHAGRGEGRRRHPDPRQL